MIRLSLLALASALALGTAPAWAQTPAAPAATAASNERWTWDLTRLFANDAAWDAERQAFAAEIPKIAALRGTLGRDAAALRQALDAQSAANQRLSRLWVYASTQNSTQTRLPRNQERSRLMSSLWAQYSAAVAWMEPEIQSLGAARIDGFLRAEPGLKKHEVRLRNALRMARHTLSPDTEAALAAMSSVINSPTTTRSLLINADASWPTITVDGKPQRLNDIGYVNLRQHPDRAVRKEVFDRFWKAYQQYENTTGSLLAARVEAGNVSARLRQHPTAIAATLAPLEIPEQVVRTLVAQAHEGLPTLHRYFKLRQRLMKLPDLHYYDIYPAVVQGTRKYTIEDSIALTLESVAPLGNEYVQGLRAAMAERSMHVYPGEGKQSGAYQTSVYGLTPFVFLNHQDDFNSLSTFTHEWGHGMHSVFAQRTQPYETAGYSLYVAEIAAITNEVLLAEHLLQRTTDPKERLFLLDQVMEGIRGTFFRQTMFAEFELAAHDAQQRGEALSGRKFTEIYCNLLRKYHGADAGVMTIDPQYCQEWAYIPHFFRPFYVYVYATSMAASAQLGAELAAGKPGAQERYLNVLRAGGAVPPYKLLKDAGVDLASPAPYRALMDRMNRVLDEMERLMPAQ